jgi:predicted DNA-binding protein YlxM (UPF0122 family)
MDVTIAKKMGKSLRTLTRSLSYIATELNMGSGCGRMSLIIQSARLGLIPFGHLRRGNFPKLEPKAYPKSKLPLEKRFDKKTLQKIVGDYTDDRLSTKEITTRYNISKKALYRLLDKRKKPHQRYEEHLEEKFDEEALQQIVDDYVNDGLSEWAISRKYKVRYQNISRFLKRRGIPIRQVRPRPKQIEERFSEEKRNRIIADYVLGLSLEKVAAKHNIQPTSLYRYLGRQGISFRLNGTVPKQSNMTQGS